MFSLTNTIQTAVSQFPGMVGVVIQDLTGGESVQINENEPFPAASIIKLPILWEFFRQVEAGLMTADSRLTLTPTDKVGGAGVLQVMEDGLQPTLKDLARLMIVLSDNTATNLLIDLLGMAAINQTIRGLGFSQTVLQRKMMDFEQAQAGFDNITTAAETAELLRCILISEKLTAESRTTMLNILKQQIYNDRLSGDWPEETIFAHKTGNLIGIEHDAGILFVENPASPERPIILVVFTKEAPSPAGTNLCREIGRLVYHHYYP